LIKLENEKLQVVVVPEVGGTIRSIRHLELDSSVLGETPWDTVDLPELSVAARDEATWLTRYSGGWPLLFPNGGDACEYGGASHGFHGEASISPWRAELSRDGKSVHLRRHFFTVPVEMSRTIEVDDEVVRVTETVRMHGQVPVEVMWGHHPTFGSDLLDGPFEIVGGARTVVADDEFDAAANPLLPGGHGDWPLAKGKSGPFDMSRPTGRLGAMACLQEFVESWVSVRRLDNRVAVALSWEPDVFPLMWLWIEFGGTSEAPWFGRGRLLGLEPNTTWPARGLAASSASGGSLMVIEPGRELTSRICLHVFRPAGTVTGVDHLGRARSGDVPDSS
jgi:hypothetical protein